MKNNFINLFNYDKWANVLIIDTIARTNSPQKSIVLLAHLLAAQQIWLARCHGVALMEPILWPDQLLENMISITEDNHVRWIAYLNRLNEPDFNKIIVYKNSKGESFKNKLSDILAHVINHGTHHRAQAGQHLILAGADELPGTDYILYMRTLPDENPKA